jgi:Plasmid pRiA4b ORF-3-like protein
MTLYLKIQIKNITKPPVWRKIAIPNNFSFHKLHCSIQAVFGWGDYHLYQFSPSGWGSHPIIQAPGAYSGDNYDLDATETLLSKLVTKKGQKFSYIYDFGDDWDHTIVVEKITDEKSKQVVVIDGKGTCPPEDCGGPWGYENLKQILADKNHPKYEKIANRVLVYLDDDGTWNANRFDKEEAQINVNDAILDDFEED